jgi:hypothetical protein
MKHVVRCGCAYDDKREGILWCPIHRYAGELFELAKLSRDIVDDDLENRPARHSLGSLHARLKHVISNCEKKP